MPVPVALLFSNGILPVKSEFKVEVAGSTLETSEPAFMLASISLSPPVDRVSVGVCRDPYVEAALLSVVDWVGVSLKMTGMVFVGEDEKSSGFGLRRPARRVS